MQRHLVVGLDGCRLEVETEVVHFIMNLRCFLSVNNLPVPDQAK